MATVHLHRDDVPDTLALLGDRDTLPAGYTPGVSGADVDWDVLAESYLSTSEKAVVHIAHGCAILERHGGDYLPNSAPKSGQRSNRSANDGTQRCRTHRTLGGPRRPRPPLPAVPALVGIAWRADRGRLRLQHAREQHGRARARRVQG